MNRRRLPDDIPTELLRDHGDRARIERIWQSVEADLPLASRRQPARALLLMPAMALATFGVGVAVGARWFGAEPPPPPPVVTVEPAVVAEPGAAVPVAQTPARTPDHRLRTRRRTPVQSGVPEAPGTASAAVEMVEVPEPSAPLLPAQWQLFADDGLYPEALAAVERQGGFDAVLSAATAEQLMLLVDVARATGQRDRAILALRRVVSQHGSDPNAPVAAWMLGNELAKAGDPEGAAQAFATYRALSPQGDFAEDALARLFEGAVEQGNLEHARRLAEQYANDFPDGPRGEDIRAGLAGLEQRRARRTAITTTEAQSEGAIGAPTAPPAALSSDPGQ
jgi:hypothetical protein